jgi:hypothetical protein
MAKVGIQQPNWFDKEFDGPMEKATAEQALADIAKCPRIVQEVKDALSAHDANAKKPNFIGPTRAQTVRDAIVKVLQADK